LSREFDRFGFSIVFLDRKIILDIFYRYYSDRNKIILEQKITIVEIFSESIAVYTAGRFVYRDDLVVDTDSIYSIVRKEIWRTMENTISTRV